MRNPGGPTKLLPKSNEMKGLHDASRYFNEIAPRWDEMRQTYFSHKVRDRALCAAHVQPRRLAVDVGAGTGFITQGLIVHGLKVLAIDESLPMLRVLQRKAFDPTSLHCCIGGAECLPVRSDAVDYVFANMCLHHAMHPPAAIGEMARILKKGGSLIITDLDEHEYEFLMAERTDRWMGFRRRDMRTWFSEAGLEDLMVSSTGERARVPSDSTDNSADVSIFVARGKKMR